MAHTLFIDGGAGTTGLEIADRMAGRSEFALLTLADADRKDPARRAEALNGADFVILCLPDDAARDAALMIRNAATRVIDASSAHRTDSAWTYGFPELTPGSRVAIAAARFVSNPGCYPTGFLALAAPLVAAGALPADRFVSVNAVSGYSGGGKTLIDRFEAEGAPVFRSYGLSLGHKHPPEMRHHAGLPWVPIFTPAVVPAFRGMIVDVPVRLDGESPAQLHHVLAAHYAGSEVIRVAPMDGVVDELLLRADSAPHDGMTLHVFADEAATQARLIARLDNLGKGASGACVQNLNLMAGLPETAGLRL